MPPGKRHRGESIAVAMDVCRELGFGKSARKALLEQGFSQTRVSQLVAAARKHLSPGPADAGLVEMEKEPNPTASQRRVMEAYDDAEASQNLCKELASQTSQNGAAVEAKTRKEQHRQNAGHQALQNINTSKAIAKLSVRKHSKERDAARKHLSPAPIDAPLAEASKTLPTLDVDATIIEADLEFQPWRCSACSKMNAAISVQCGQCGHAKQAISPTVDVDDVTRASSEAEADLPELQSVCGFSSAARCPSNAQRDRGVYHVSVDGFPIQSFFKRNLKS